jgi:hypothetical protein
MIAFSITTNEENERTKSHTCNIANSSSRKKRLHAINIGRNIPLHAAIAATAPPSAKEPTRLITIEALYLL